MDKIYKLLRNNQQTGPYTLEELVQLQLKPFDLIWATGITAGWMYPSEIDLIKPYLTADKKETPTAVEPNASPAHIPSVAPEKDMTPDTPVKEQEVVLSSARHIFISMPAGVVAKAAPMQQAAMSNPVAEETPEQKLERKAMELRQRVQALAEAKKDEGEEPTLDTKYSRSLDDIKEEYTHWMHEQKHKGLGLPRYQKQWLSAALVLLLAGAGYVTFHWVVKRGDSNPTAAVVQHPVHSINSTAESSEPVTQSVINTDDDDRHTQLLEDLERADRQIEKDLARIAAHRKPATSKAKTRIPAPSSTSDTYDSYEVNSLPTATVSKKQEPTISPATDVRTVAYPSEKRAAPLSQQIDVKAKYLWTSRSKGLSGVELVMRNNSSQLLKTVAIDVFYYKDGRLLGKETVYFNNIPPGGSLTITAPGKKRASSATYQLGLISSDAGLYVARQ